MIPFYVGLGGVSFVAALLLWAVYRQDGEIQALTRRVRELEQQWESDSPAATPE